MPRNPKLMLNSCQKLRRGLAMGVLGAAGERRSTTRAIASGAHILLAGRAVVKDRRRGRCMATRAPTPRDLRRPASVVPFATGHHVTPPVRSTRMHRRTAAIGVCAVALTFGAPPAAAQPVAPAAARWTRGAVCYEVFVRSFQDSNGDGI